MHLNVEKVLTENILIIKVEDARQINALFLLIFLKVFLELTVFKTPKIGSR